MPSSGRFLVFALGGVILAVWLAMGYIAIDQRQPDLALFEGQPKKQFQIGQVLRAFDRLPSFIPLPTWALAPTQTFTPTPIPTPTPTPCVPSCPSYQCGDSADCGCGVTYTPPGCLSDYSCIGNACVCNPPPSCPGSAQCGAVGNSCSSRSCGSGSDRGRWSKGCSTTFATNNGFSCTVNGSRSCQGGSLTWSGCNASNVCADNGYECGRPSQCVNGGDACGTCEEDDQPGDEYCAAFKCQGYAPRPPRNLRFHHRNADGQNEVFNPVHACGAVPLTFTWDAPTDTTYLDTYVLQVDDDVNFGSPIYSQEVSATSQVVTLAPGNWYWRVASRNVFYQNGQRRVSDSAWVKWE